MDQRIDSLEMAPVPAASSRLLVVDDEFEFASIIKIVAGEAGFDVRIVACSAEFEQAIASVKKRRLTATVTKPFFGSQLRDVFHSLSQRPS